MKARKRGNPRGFIDYDNRHIATTAVRKNKVPAELNWVNKTFNKLGADVAHVDDMIADNHPAILLKQNRFCCLSIDNGKQLPSELKLRKHTWRIKTPNGYHYLYDICSPALAALWSKTHRIILSEGVEFWFGNNYIIAPSDFSNSFEHVWEGSHIQNSCSPRKVPIDLINYVLNKQEVYEDYLRFMEKPQEARNFLKNRDKNYNY